MTLVEKTDVALTLPAETSTAETVPKLPVPVTVRVAIELGNAPVGPVTDRPVGPVEPVVPVNPAMPVGPVKLRPVGPVEPVEPVEPDS